MSTIVDQVLDSVQVAEPSDVVVHEVVSEATEEVATEEEETEPEEVVSEAVKSESVSTQEVVHSVQEILSSTETNSSSVGNSDLENKEKGLEERLDKLIELLRSSFSQYEHDENEFIWTYNMIGIREALNEL